jgi:hypothetical protein
VYAFIKISVSTYFRASASVRVSQKNRLRASLAMLPEMYDRRDGVDCKSVTIFASQYTQLFKYVICWWALGNYFCVPYVLF